jgi:hypothetical protein
MWRVGDLPTEKDIGRAAAPLRAFDPVLLLPASPRRVVVVGSEVDPYLGGDALRGAVDRWLQDPPIVTGGKTDQEEEIPILALASSGGLEAALGTRAEMVAIVGRDARRKLLRSGFVVARYLPLPDGRRPEVLLPLDQPVAVRYALSRWRPAAHADVGRAANYGKRLRDTILGRLPRRLPIPGGRVIITVGARQGGIPLAVAAAAEVVGEPVSAWLPTFPRGVDPGSRNVVHLLPPGARDPAWVIKLARRRGLEASFDQEEAALTMLRERGGVIAARAPRLIGRTEVDGRAASVESAAAGTGLDRLLASSASRAVKLRALESVADWLDEVARATLAPTTALEPERARMVKEVLPRWGAAGLRGDLVTSLPPLPAVFVHGDMWEENVIVDRDGFTALDWEWSRPHGFPLWDKASFASTTLGLLDGARSVEERARHFLELWSGAARSSSILFRWLRKGAEEAKVPPEAVPVVVTLCWLDDPERARLEHLGALDPDTPDPDRLLDRLPRLWLDDQRLGPRWPAWSAAEWGAPPL